MLGERLRAGERVFLCIPDKRYPKRKARRGLVVTSERVRELLADEEVNGMPFSDRCDVDRAARSDDQGLGGGGFAMVGASMAVQAAAHCLRVRNARENLPELAYPA